MISRVSSHNYFEDKVFEKLSSKLNKDITYKEIEPYLTRIAWGTYKISGYPGRITNIDQKYSFDDGAIWQVVKGEDGQEYLVKEVENNEIVRAASTILIDKNNVYKIGKALGLFNIDSKTQKYFNDKGIVNYLCSSVNKELTTYAQNYITNNNRIESKVSLNKTLRKIVASDVGSIHEINRIIDYWY